MKGFFLCILIALFASINSIFGTIFFLYNIDLCFFIQSILNLIDLLFWAIFFLKILNDRKDYKIIQILFISTLFIAVYLLYYNNTDRSNLHILALSNVCKTIFCVLFFQQYFQNLSNKNILSEPSFWIVTGQLFYSSLSLPFYALNSYIKQQFSPLIAYNIFSISNILIIIMYFFFIKAYLCTNRLHKA